MRRRKAVTSAVVSEHGRPEDTRVGRDGALPVARLLNLDIPIHWQEAVAVVNAADRLATTTDLPITLECCYITRAGEVLLSRDGAEGQGEGLSSTQLLAALLPGYACPSDLTLLASTTDERGPSGRGRAVRPRLDLRWCLGDDPKADVARLAARALGSLGGGEQAAIAEAVTPLLASSEAGHAVEPVGRRPVLVVTVRVRRPSPGVALALAAVLLAGVGSVVLIGAVVGRRVERPSAVGAASPVPDLPARPLHAAAAVSR